MMKRQWANHLVKEDFQDKLEKIQRKRIKETNDDEDSDGQPILTKRQQLSRQEAIKILDTILKDIRGDKVKELKSGCKKQMINVLKKERNKSIE